jgi:hypothetical protein
MLLLRIAFAVAAIALAGAALAGSPGARAGLWERTATRQMEGPPVSPVADLSKLAPEQRARMEQMLAARTATAPTASVVRYCVAPGAAPSWEALARAERDDAGCTRSVRDDSPAGYRASLACTAGNAATSIDFAAVGPERLRGTITTVTQDAGGPRTVRVDLDDRWIGPDCGPIVPGAPVRVKG